MPLQTFVPEELWRRQVRSRAGNTVTPQEFGAKGDGVTNDTPAFTRALAALGDTGGTVLVNGNARYLIDTTLTIPINCALEGSYVNPGRQPTVSGEPLSFDNLGSTLIVNSSATIRMSYSSAISGFLIKRKGMSATPWMTTELATTEVAAFAGTAISIGEDASPDIPVQDVYIARLLVLGFENAIYAYKVARIRAEYVSLDCTNGILDEIDTDITHINFCHAWPFLTTHLNDVDLLKRDGTAFRAQNVADWLKFTNCFEYGYAIGFHINNADHVTLLGCGADHPTGATTYVGFQIEGTSKETALIGCQSAAQQIGVWIDIGTATNKATARIIGCDFWEQKSRAIEVASGTAIIMGCNFSGGVGHFIDIDASCSGFTIMGNTFDDFSDPTINISASVAVDRIKILGNIYVNVADAADQMPDRMPGAYTAGAATDSTGYITMYDNGGTLRKIMVQA